MSIKPLMITDPFEGKYSLLLNAGDTSVDELVETLEHEPNGYFWEGVARWLIAKEAPHLEGKLDMDPEGGMFCAYGPDKAALEDLGQRMARLANDADEMRQLIQKADAEGFDFDD